MGSFDVGFKKVQWGVEENTSSSRLLAVERSATNRFWGENADYPGSSNSNLGFGARHIGLFYTKKFTLNTQHSLEYMASLVNPQQGWSNKAINVAGIYTSLSYTFKHSETNQHTIGLNYGNTPMYIQGTLNPPSSSPQNCGLFVGEISGFNPYIKSQFDALILQVEYFRTQVNSGTTQYPTCNNYSNHTPTGYTVIAAYKFIPKIEGVVRYSVLETDGLGTVLGQGVRDGVTTPLATTSYNTVRSYYAGVNYYIHDQNIKLQLGYEHLDFLGYIASYVAGAPQIGSGSAAADTIRAQLQLNF